MKVIILVQSIDKPDYIKLREAQQQTWDSIPCDNVRTIYYKPNGKTEELVGNIINTPENWHWSNMYKSFIKALRLLLKEDWDYIFKTDNSTYVDKEVLYNTLLTKPRVNYFGGSMYETSETSPPEAFNCMWGEGYAISRDIAEYLVDFFHKAPWLNGGVDDGVVTKILIDKVSLDKTLHVYELAKHDKKIEPGNHVYRVRLEDHVSSPAVIHFDNLSSIIDSDIISMHNIHSVIKKK